MELFYVTSNEKKIEASKEIFTNSNIVIKPIDLNIQEIQGEPLEVAIQKAKDAYFKLKKPLIINDSTFHIEALNDFPSTYTSYVEKTLGDEFILKMLVNQDNRNAYYLDILVYIDEFGYQIFTDKTKGKISLESFEGKFYPYDKIFIKENDLYPVAYYSDKIDELYQNNTYNDLKKFLGKRKVSRGITFFDDKVLLLHRIRKENFKYLDYYAIPGGGVECDETIEQACIRELFEETSLDININSYLGFEEYETGICYYFLTNYLAGIPILGGEEKEKNNPDNFYEIELLDLNELDNINMYGMGIEMIKKAYNIYIKSKE